MRTILLCFLIASCSHLHKLSVSAPPSMKGRFMDDYGITYQISDSVFQLGSKAKYHILEWNEKAQYILTKNDSQNPTEPDLYTRIDYVDLNNMEPYSWAFCLTIYDAKTKSIAVESPPADRAHPKTGCSGFPFSRMKRID